jgi:hypothetical protein
MGDVRKKNAVDRGRNAAAARHLLTTTSRITPAE